MGVYIETNPPPPLPYLKWSETMRAADALPVCSCSAPWSNASVLSVYTAAHACILTNAKLPEQHIMEQRLDMVRIIPKQCDSPGCSIAASPPPASIVAWQSGGLPTTRHLLF